MSQEGWMQWGWKLENELETCHVFGWCGYGYIRTRVKIVHVIMWQAVKTADC